ncbi:MAG: amino acid ABC transporter substrate-binding protein [Gemmatimonadota bacterium]|nr:amino acid ABC transporter substrate-binding protein [Gemmatimonadota bacterium]MDE2870958.1 amino acid ABC transporter substrate-binding protein [Gemmatimonadota bacterium]
MNRTRPVSSAPRRSRRSCAVFPVLLGSLAAALGTGCSDPAEPSEPGPIVLAATFSETGRFARLGTEMARGYRMAVQMLNGAGGVAGRQVSLLLLDDASDAATAARIYQEYVASDSVDLLLGPYSSPLTEAVIEVAEGARMPLVAAMAAAPGIWSGKGRQWGVQMLNPGPTYLQGSVEVAAQNGARTAALVYEDTQFPVSVAEGVRLAAQAHGLSIVVDRSYPAGGANHQALVATARDSGADLFIGGGYYDDAVAFTRAVDAALYTPKLVSLNLGPAQADFANEVGDLAECVAGNTPWLPTIRTAGFITDSETLSRQYIAAHSEQPSYYVAGGFGAVELIAQAIDVVADATGRFEVADVRDHLFSRGTETVLGPFKVYPMGDEHAGAQQALKGLQVQWQDDGDGGLERRIIHPETVADADPCFWR